MVGGRILPLWKHQFVRGCFCEAFSVHFCHGHVAFRIFPPSLFRLCNLYGIHDTAKSFRRWLDYLPSPRQSLRSAFVLVHPLGGGGYMCWVSSRKAVLPRRRGRQKILNRQRNFIGVYLATMRMLDGSEWDGRGMELAGLSSTKNQWLQFSWNHCRDSLPPPANSLRANLAVPRLRNVPCIHIRRKLFASQCRLQFCQLRCNRPGMVLVMVSSDE